MNRTPDTAFQAVVAAPFGAVGIATAGDRLAEIRYLPPGTAEIAPRNALAEGAAAQILRFLDDADSPFDLPLAAAGTPFRRRVWAEISAIGRGQTRTYGDLARRIRSAARAVGQACGDNPFPLVVPCHRVVGAGDIGGFAHAGAGYLVATKRWLLAHEGAVL